MEGFVEAYVARRYRDAAVCLLPEIDTPLGEVERQDPLLPFVLNYVDAMLRHPCYHAYIANRQLQEVIEGDVQLMLEQEGLLSALKRDAPIFLSGVKGAKILEEVDPETRGFSGFLLAEQSQMILDSEEREALVSQVEGDLRKEVEACVRFSQNFLRVREKLIPWCEEKPYLPMSTTSPKGMFPDLLDVLEQFEHPCIITEPYNLPWKVIGDHLQGKGTFLFPTTTSFVQCLQYDDLVDLIMEEDHCWLIGDVPLSEQEAPGKIGAIGFATKNPWYVENAKEWVGSIKDATTFYELSKSLVFMSEGERLGDRRFPALWSDYALKNWRDPYKARPKALPPLSRPLLPDRMDLKLTECIPIEPKRALSSKKPFKLVHVVNTIMDHGHAPSEILRSLVKHHCRDDFEVSVVTTEGGIFRPVEYPYHAFAGKDSQEWGCATIARFRGQGVPVTVYKDCYQTYQVEARQLAQQLSDEKVDIAVFHIPTVVTLMAARYSDLPRKAFFDHGGLPTQDFDHSLVLPSYLGLPAYAGFDVIVGCEPAVLKHVDYYEKMGTKLVAEPIVLDVRERWSSENPVTRKELGVARDAFLMTTVSMHLEERLNRESIAAVIEILKRIPRAVYCPIGGVHDPEKMLKPFAEADVADRVKLVGYQENPSRFLRGMDLYLNEIPFGGGIALLEAMAAGLPVVSVWDESGPPQVRLGGIYFDKERMVTNSKEYVNLACQLAENQSTYYEWRSAVLDIYEARTDVAAYVRRLEAHFLGAQ